MDPRHQAGKSGQTLVEEHYVKRGYRLITRNWRYKNHLEIDLILQKESDLVAVEVKTQQSLQLKSPLDAIHPRQIQRVVRALTIFADTNGYSENHLQVDVATVILEPFQIETFESVDLSAGFH